MPKPDSLSLEAADLIIYANWGLRAKKHLETFALSGLSQPAALVLSAIAGLAQNSGDKTVLEQLKILTGIAPENQTMIYSFYARSIYAPRGIDIVYLEAAYAKLPEPLKNPITLLAFGYQLGADPARLALVRPTETPKEFLFSAPLLGLTPQKQFREAVNLLFIPKEQVGCRLNQSQTPGTHEDLIYQTAQSALSVLRQQV